MSAGSASDFLTFSRRLLISKPSLRLSATPSSSLSSSSSITRPSFLSASRNPNPSLATTRPFASSAPRATEIGHGKPHATDKSDTLDVQSDAAKSGKEARASDDQTSQATSQADTRNNNKRAKEDHPEAPEPVIGMNAERGAKGH